MKKCLNIANPPGMVGGRACCSVIKMNNLHSVTIVNGAVCAGAKAPPVLTVLTSLFISRPVLCIDKDAQVLNNGRSVIKYT